jgi:hypothetical protein
MSSSQGKSSQLHPAVAEKSAGCAAMAGGAFRLEAGVSVSSGRVRIRLGVMVGVGVSVGMGVRVILGVGVGVSDGVAEGVVVYTGALETSGGSVAWKAFCTGGEPQAARRRKVYNTKAQRHKDSKEEFFNVTVAVLPLGAMKTTGLYSDVKRLAGMEFDDWATIRSR